MEDNIIKVGKYVVIQRQNYKKLHKFNKSDGSITLGRDSIELTGIEGCKFYSLFKLIPKGTKKERAYSLEPTQELTELKSQLNIKQSGTDNRSILDDGKSQKLSANEIESLRGENASSSEIVETLISNSNTFHQKTEFSQEKYLKKKEKKYFEYIQILKPNLRIVAEVMYRLEPAKIQNLRTDTISQIISYANIHSAGDHLLYDSGSNGILTAAILNSIGSSTGGRLLHMHPGNMSQKQALLAMNFPSEQIERCVSVNIYSALRQYYQGIDTHDTTAEEDDDIAKKSNKISDNDGPPTKILKLDEEIVAKESDEAKNGVLKNGDPKKPKWHFDNIKAAEILTQKLDSLVIACKEDPLNIFNELSQFIKPGRPFVIYHTIQEPLKQCYLSLRSMSHVSVLKLTNNWLRNYQILPERTHPDVNMNQNGCYLLTGYIFK